MDGYLFVLVDVFFYLQFHKIIHLSPPPIFQNRDCLHKQPHRRKFRRPRLYFLSLSTSRPSTHSLGGKAILTLEQRTSPRKAVCQKEKCEDGNRSVKSSHQCSSPRAGTTDVEPEEDHFQGISECPLCTP